MYNILPGCFIVIFCIHNYDTNTHINTNRSEEHDVIINALLRVQLNILEANENYKYIT